MRARSLPKLVLIFSFNSELSFFGTYYNDKAKLSVDGKVFAFLLMKCLFFLLMLE